MGRIYVVSRGMKIGNYRSVISFLELNEKHNSANKKDTESKHSFNFVSSLRNKSPLSPRGG